MPKRKPKEIPKHGRSQKEITRDYKNLRSYSSDVPIGNTDPTMVQGVLWGGMPNASRKATGGLKQLKGKRR